MRGEESTAFILWPGMWVDRRQSSSVVVERNLKRGQTAQRNDETGEPQRFD